MHTRSITRACLLLVAFCHAGLAAESTSTARARSPIYFPPAGGEWEHVRPAAAGWNEEKLEAALTFAGECNSSGVVILHRGKILVERYWDLNNPSGRKDAAGRSIEHVASIRKSVIAILMGIAQHHGSLRLEDPVSKHLGAGWSKAAQEQEQLITVRHLLTMTSGLADDMTFEAAAGPRWRYNNAACGQTLPVLAAAEKQSINDLTRGWLTGRVGMGDSSWVAPVEPPAAMSASSSGPPPAIWRVSDCSCSPKGGGKAKT